MRILIVNDDGITADGINVLAETFCKDNDIYMIAPESERSGFSHSLTISEHIECKEVTKNPKIKAYAIKGTPADCVKFGVLNIMKNFRPDLVISGINNGANVGSDIMYSGTVSAAFEGAYLGIKSIAISLTERNTKDKKNYVKAAEFLYKNLNGLLDLNLSSETILNINYPNYKSFKGAKVTKAGVSYYNDEFIEHENTASYKLVGLPINQPGSDLDNDVEWSKKGYATLSALHLDKNNYEVLNRIKDKVIFK